jgi:hypothetical protein
VAHCMWIWRQYCGSPSLEGHIEDFEKNNLDQRVTKVFIPSFTFVVVSFGDMEDDREVLGCIRDHFFKWMGMISLKEWKLCFKELNVDQEAKKIDFLSWMGIWTTTSTFRAWSIGNLWKLIKLGYDSSRTPRCGTILDTTHGVHDNSQRRGK